MLINIFTDAIERGWENFIARPSGPMNFRFIMQPLMAGILAIRSGIKDAKEKQPPFLWSAIADSTNRKAILKKAWKQIRVPFLIACILDIIYEFIIHRSFYPFEMLFTAILLALIPYLLLRGPANRITRLFMKSKTEE